MLIKRLIYRGYGYALNCWHFSAPPHPSRWGVFGDRPARHRQNTAGGGGCD